MPGTSTEGHESQLANLFPGWQLVARRAKQPRPRSEKLGPSGRQQRSADATMVTNRDAKAKRKGKWRRKREANKRRLLGCKPATTPEPIPASAAVKDQHTSASTDVRRSTGEGETLNQVHAAAVRAETKGTGDGGKPRPGKRDRQAARKGSDSVSPLAAAKKPRLFSPRQPGVSYAQAATDDLSVVIVDERTGRITQELAAEFTRAATREIARESMQAVLRKESVNLGFQGKPIHSDSTLKVRAKNEASVELLRKVASKMPSTSGVNLVVRRQSEVPKWVRCGILVPNEDGGWEGVTDLHNCLHAQNPWAGADRWRLSNVDKQDRGWFLTVSVPEDLVPEIVAQGRCLYLGMGQVYLKFQGPGGKFFAELPTSGSGAATTEGTSDNNNADAVPTNMTPAEAVTPSEQVREEQLLASPTKDPIPEPDGKSQSGVRTREALSEGEDLPGRLTAGLRLREEGASNQDEPPHAEA